MTESMPMPERVDRYVRGEFDEPQSAAFEAELLESPDLQDALEVALGLQRAARFAEPPVAAEVLPLRGHARAVDGPLAAGPSESAPGWRNWALAASVALAVTSTTLLWRADARNAELQTRVDQLGRPLVEVLTVPVDVMRSADPAAPDVRLRRPAGPALLLLDVEVAEQLAGAATLDLLVHGPDGAELSRGTAVPTADGRVEIALRADALPDGILTLQIGAPDAGARQTRRVELLPSD